MKYFKLLQSIPFLLTLTIIVIINFSNQKQYTNLKILLWETPSLSLGNYLAISSGSGFILSYIITTNLSRSHKRSKKPQIQYKFDSNVDQTDIANETNNEYLYNNTLIERNIKDPSPTINACFRVIGKTNRNNKRQHNNISNQFNSLDTQVKDEDQYHENEINQLLNDWEDDNYINW